MTLPARNTVAYKRLRQLAVYLGSGISRPFKRENVGVPVLRSNNVSGGTVNCDDLRYWYAEDPRGADLTTARPRRNDILVNFVNGSRKELGKAGLFLGAPENCIVSTNFFILRLNTDVADPRFINYFFQGQDYRRWLHTITGFSGPGSFNQQQFSSLRVPVFSLPEQQKIAAILGTWDAAIEQTGQLIEAKKKLKKALAQQLLTGKKRFKEFTDQWGTIRLGKLFKERTETGYGHLPLLSITGSDGITNRDDLERRDTSNTDKSKYLRICPDDIGYNTMRMWQGVSAVSQLEGIVSPAYTVCIPDKERVDPQFMGYLFKFYPIVFLFYRHSQGMVSDTWNLKFRHFAEIKVTIPSLSEQKRIASVLNACDTEIASLQSKLEALQRQKKGLMQKLLTGKIRVKV